MAGEPAVLLGAKEDQWVESVRESGVSGLAAPRLRFVVRSWLKGGHSFDLDNLVHPALKVVGASPPLLRSVWATVEVGATPGVEIYDAPPPPTPEDSATVHLAQPPKKSVKNGLALAELADLAVMGNAGQPCGCGLTLGGDTAEIVFGFDGPVKPTIDGLWPLLGGVPGKPADHRIRDLRVWTDRSLTGILVSLWLVEDLHARAADVIVVPNSSAGWLPIWEFALTYNAYHRNGDRAAAIGNGWLARWDRDRSLPSDLATARAALFFEQRRYHHFGEDPDESAGRYIRALVARISDLSGGAVPGPGDPWP